MRLCRSAASSGQVAPLYRDQRGQALILAVAVLAVTTLLTAGLTRAAWDATQASRQAYVRAQTLQAAASTSELHHAILLRTLRDKLPQNIIDQGCKQTNQTGTACLVPGNDTAKTSGVRRARIQLLAQQSSQGWSQLQTAFLDALRQVMPLAPELDPYRTPPAQGFAGLAISSAGASSIPNTRWRAYGIVAPVPGNPITFNPTTRTATIPFEIRAYGWAAYTQQPGGGSQLQLLEIRAQATTYASTGTITLTYPNCSVPDEICQYPDSVRVDVPVSYLIAGDPAVSWPPGWP